MFCERLPCLSGTFCQFDAEMFGVFLATSCNSTRVTTCELTSHWLDSWCTHSAGRFACVAKKISWSLKWGRFLLCRVVVWHTKKSWFLNTSHGEIFAGTSVRESFDSWKFLSRNFEANTRTYAQRYQGYLSEKDLGRGTAHRTVVVGGPQANKSRQKVRFLYVCAFQSKKGLQF